MVVQCDQCNAKFRLDDSKVTENGVKVRCSKCKNIFLVRKAVPTEEADFDSLLSGLGAKSPEPAIMTEEPVLSAETPSVTEPPETAVTGFFAETKEEAGVEAPEKEEPDFIEYASDSSQESSPAKPSHQETEDFKLKDMAGEEF